MIPNLYQSGSLLLRWGIWIVTKASNSVFLIALGALSIIAFLLSFLLFISTDAVFEQVIAGCILGTMVISILFDIQRRRSHPESQNLVMFRAFVYLCSILSVIFIFTSSIATNLTNLVPKIDELSKYLTISFGGSTPFILPLAFCEAHFELKHGQQKITDRMLRIKDAGVPVSIQFDSITKKFVGLHAPTIMCPHCLGQIDFNEMLEWFGPTAVACGHCGRVVEILDLVDSERIT